MENAPCWQYCVIWAPKFLVGGKTIKAFLNSKCRCLWCLRANADQFARKVFDGGDHSGDGFRHPCIVASDHTHRPLPAADDYLGGAIEARLAKHINQLRDSYQTLAGNPLGLLHIVPLALRPYGSELGSLVC